MSARKRDSEKKAKRLGRPVGSSLSKDDFRQRYPIRLNSKEQALIAQAASKIGLPPSTWIRMIALKAANEVLGIE